MTVLRQIMSVASISFITVRVQKYIVIHTYFIENKMPLLYHYSYKSIYEAQYMIASLDGVKETVNFTEDSSILLYDNTDYEEYPVHWHTPLEIIVPLEGIYTIAIDNVEITLKEGEMAMIAPGVLHKLYAQAGRRIIFQIDLSLLQSFKEIESFISFMGPLAVITAEDYPDIHQKVNSIMMDILKEYSDKDSYSELSIYSKFLEMFTLIARSFSHTHERFANIRPNKIGEYNELFLNICDYIKKHCTEDISLDEISEMAGFSKYHFSRLFKDFTNCSYYHYLNLKRIAYSETLLLDPTMKITEVALASGFNSISAFMRMFKNIKGCTPTTYRELHRK